VRQYRALDRVLTAAVANDGSILTDPRVVNFCRNLVKLGEHTWGNDEGGLFNINYTNAYFDAHAPTDPGFTNANASFIDQREYIDRAMAALGNHPLATPAAAALAAAEPSLPSWAGATPVDPPTAPVACTTSGVSVGVAGDGTLWLQHAAGFVPLAQLTYVTHDEQEFIDFIHNYSLAYLRDEYINSGFGKWGLAACGGIHTETSARPVSTSSRASDQDHCELLVNLTLPQGLQTTFGAPGHITFYAKVSSTANGGVAVFLDVTWSDKRPTRMAESLWLSVGPSTASHPGSHWELHKLGAWIDPTDVVVNGSRNTHGVDQGMRLVGADGAVLVAIETLDAPVVATRIKSPVVFPVDATLGPITNMHVSLFNNGWNTNYPVWTQDPSDRFRVSFVLAPDV
jgi:hypothetical protein